MKRITVVFALAALTGLLASTFGARAAEEKNEAKVLRHIVLFKFAPEASSEDIQGIVDAFVALKEKIDGIESLEWGTNVSKEKLDKGLTHGFTLTFKTQEALDAYIVHPEHKAFGKLLGGKLADVCVFDYWTN